MSKQKQGGMQIGTTGGQNSSVVEPTRSDSKSAGFVSPKTVPFLIVKTLHPFHVEVPLAEGAKKSDIPEYSINDNGFFKPCSAVEVPLTESQQIRFDNNERISRSYLVNMKAYASATNDIPYSQTVMMSAMTECFRQLHHMRIPVNAYIVKGEYIRYQDNFVFRIMRNGLYPCHGISHIEKYGKNGEYGWSDSGKWLLKNAFPSIAGYEPSQTDIDEYLKYSTEINSGSGSARVLGVGAKGRQRKSGISYLLEIEVQPSKNGFDEPIKGYMYFTDKTASGEGRISYIRSAVKENKCVVHLSDVLVHQNFSKQTSQTHAFRCFADDFQFASFNEALPVLTQDDMIGTITAGHSEVNFNAQFEQSQELAELTEVDDDEFELDLKEDTA